MVLAVANRVRETSTTTGTGTYSLVGAASNHQTFVAGIGNANDCHYVVVDQGGSGWEVGRGTVTDDTPDTLSRDAIIASSNGGAAVSWSAGTRDVMCVWPADLTQMRAIIDALLQGKHTIWVPAAAMRPTVSNGCAALVDVETTAGRPDMQVLDFDASADEHAQFQVAMPKSWNLGTVTFQAFWTTAGAVTTGIAVALQGVFVPDNSTIDVVYGTAVVVTDDAQSQVEEMLVAVESGAVTIGGSPADDGMCYFRVFRDVGDGNDDMTQDMRLIGIKLFITLDAGNDA